MNIYVICFIVLLIETAITGIGKKTVYINAFGKKHDIREVLFFIDCIVLIIISSFRNNTVGTDAKAYFYWIDSIGNYNILNIKKWSDASGIEIGYGLVTKIIYFFTSSKEMVLVVINSMMMLALYKFCKEKSSNLLLSLYLFLTYSMFNQSMNVHGQYVAAMFLLLSLEKAYKRDYKKYIIYIIIALSFHISAIIGIVFLPIIIFEDKAVRNSIIIVLVTAVGSFFAPRVINTIVSKTIYSVYLYKEISSESGIGLLMNALILLVFVVFYKQFREYDEYASIWLYATAITLGLNFYIRELAMIGRMMIFFKATYLISIPNFATSFKNEKIRLIITTVLITLFGIYYMHSIYNGSCFSTVPYTSDILNIH